MLEPARRFGIGEVMQDGSVWLLEEDGLERFLDSLALPEWARRKLEIGWRNGIRRTVHVRLERTWLVGFTRAAYRGDLPAEAYCRRLGDRSALESHRFERLLEATRQVRRTHGFVHFGSCSTVLDSHLKIVVRDLGVGLNRRLLTDLERFERCGWLEVRRDPRNGDLWMRAIQNRVE
jgi:hypothetical protein